MKGCSALANVGAVVAAIARSVASPTTATNAHDKTAVYLVVIGAFPSLVCDRQGTAGRGHRPTRTVAERHRQRRRAGAVGADLPGDGLRAAGRDRRDRLARALRTLRSHRVGGRK